MSRKKRSQPPIPSVSTKPVRHPRKRKSGKSSVNKLNEMPMGFRDLLREARRQLSIGGIDDALAYLSDQVKEDNRQSGADRWSTLATTLASIVQQQDPKTALLLVERVIESKPQHIEAWVVAGVLQDRLGSRQEAARSMLYVTRSNDATPEQVLRAANLLVRFGEQRIALERAKTAYDTLGQPLHWTSAVLYIAQVTADWGWISSLVRQLRQAYAEQRGAEANESPRTHLLWCADELINNEVIANWSRRNILKPVRRTPSDFEPIDNRRLRVGYLSSDFREHPGARLIKGLLRHHDRAKVELFMYCSGWDDGSAVRKELESFFDHVHSVAALSDHDAAGLIQSHGIDVLVERNGPTRANRLGILSYRPAPVQIEFLGWSGSVGGRCVDYLVTDYYCVPEEASKYYSERLIYLDKTYQVNDHAALTRGPVPTRKSVGLPEGDWLVLGMFNAINKVHGEVWDAWMQILKAVPNAILWLLDPGPEARRHIAAETARYEIDLRRIRAAPRLPQDPHLTRLQCCDLIVDPWPYGGHTSTSDALFAGVPVVALQGTNFASRVNGSLLRAAGLEVFVQPDVKTYVTFTIDLLRNRGKLEKARRFIIEKVPGSNLFDARSKARQLEAAYLVAVRLAVMGQSPVTIDARQAMADQNTASQVPETEASRIASEDKASVIQMDPENARKQRVLCTATTPWNKTPVVLVCGPSGSGASLVAELLIKAGLQAPGPFWKGADPTNPYGYEMDALRKILSVLAQNQGTHTRHQDASALIALKRFRDEELQTYIMTGSKKQPMMLKHPLLIRFLPQLRQLLDIRLIGVLRPLSELTALRGRHHGELEDSGKWDAADLYRMLFDEIINSRVPFHLIRHGDLKENTESCVESLITFSGLTVTDEQRTAAITTVMQVCTDQDQNDRAVVPPHSSIRPQPVDGNAIALRLKALTAPPDVMQKATLSVFSMLKDERYFLPHFLDHYRKLGVNNFVFLDDGSSDGSRDYLCAQPDSYVIESNYHFGDQYQGRPFYTAVKEVVPRRLLLGRWVLTVDMDEFLLLPEPFEDLQGFCDHLDSQGLRAARALMLDFFPKHLIDIASKKPENSPFSICPFFDVFSSVDWPEGYAAPSSMSYWDSIRPRLFKELLLRHPQLQKKLSGYRAANLNKVPLIKWDDHVRVLSPHRVNVHVSARNQMGLAHFKFFPGWAVKVQQAIVDNGHWNSAIEYRFLAEVAEHLMTIDLEGACTHQYRNAAQLQALGLLFADQSSVHERR